MSKELILKNNVIGGPGCLAKQCPDITVGCSMTDRYDLATVDIKIQTRDTLQELKSEYDIRGS